MKEIEIHYRGFIGFENKYGTKVIYKNGVYVGYVGYAQAPHGICDFNIYVDQHYDELMQWYEYNSVNHLIRNCK